MLLVLARLFLRLGCTAFGGPAAHIALLREEVVARRGWLREDEFLDLLGATNLIPGPNSTEMVLHVGLRQAGWAGMVVAGLAFILPAAFLSAFLAAGYARFGGLPRAEAILHLVKPVIIVVVVQALVGLTRPALKSGGLKLLAALAGGLAFLGVDEVALIFGAGVVYALPRARGWALAALGLVLLVPVVVGRLDWGEARPFSLSLLFGFFLKVGSVLYGSGYVLLSFLRTTLVDQWGWLTPSQLLDATAAGQVTPGPVFTTATFIGYLLGGPAGAVLATVGIFLPSFVFVAVSARWVPFLRRSPVAAAFLEGVNAAALALMGVVTWQLGRAALTDGGSCAVAGLSAVLLLRYRVNSAWLIVAAVAVGAVRVAA